MGRVRHTALAQFIAALVLASAAAMALAGRRAVSPAALLSYLPGKHSTAAPPVPRFNATTGQYNIVLGLFFNYSPFAGVRETLYPLYSPHFARVVFVGPPKGGQSGMGEDAGLPYLHCPDNCADTWETTLWSYSCAGMLMEAFPANETYGYLWLHDDVAFRLSALERLPLEKVWTFPPQLLLNLTDARARGSGADAVPRCVANAMHGNEFCRHDWEWFWYDTDCKTPLSPDPPPQLFPSKRYSIGVVALEYCYDNLPDGWRRYFERQHGPGVVPTEQVADAFYVPAMAAAAFQQVAVHYRAYNVAMEVAISSMLELVAHLGRAGPAFEVPARWLWREERSNLAAALQEAAGLEMVHPFKCSKPESRALLAAFFNS